jgi:hypothetical protein
MFMKLTRNLAFLAAIAVCSVHPAAVHEAFADPVSQAADKSTGGSVTPPLGHGIAPTLTIIRGGELASQTELHARGLGSLSYVAKSWDERFDGRSRFDIEFYGRFGTPGAAKDYLQRIAVLDGGKEIFVHDWDTADCSLEKAELISTPESSVFLVIGARDPNVPGRQITPQYERVSQIIRVFRLRENAGETPGVTRAYFDKVFETREMKGACTGSEVYNVMESEFKRFYKR